MKIVIIAANGNPVTAEDGGGVDGEGIAIRRVALRANRPTAGEWEQFDEISVSNGKVALKTSKGYYVTAEPDGKLSTNRKTIGEWETWSKLPNGYQSWQGKYLCCELGGVDPFLVANRELQGLWETFQIQVTGALQLTVSGTSFLLNGEAIKLKGFSSFGLLKKYIDGQDVTANIKEMQSLGILSPRIFCRCKNLFVLEPDSYTDYDDRLANLTDLLNHAGLIPQYEVLVDCWEMTLPEQMVFARRVAEVLSGFSAMFDLVNEFDSQWQKVDPLRFNKPDGVLSGRGSGSSGTNPPLSPWDYSSFHNRRDDKWLITIPKDSTLIVDGFPSYYGVHQALYYDEPKGFADTPRPDRSNSPRDAFTLGCMLGLWTSGGVCHTDNGRYSVELSEIQMDCAKEFVRGLSATS